MMIAVEVTRANSDASTTNLSAHLSDILLYNLVEEFSM